MAAAALPFAAQAQRSLLGWPPDLEGNLVKWTHRNLQATLARDRNAMNELAIEFEAIVDDLLEIRRRADMGHQQDLTTALMGPAAQQRGTGEHSAQLDGG